jgi:CheY-like chemotaxis protein
MSPAEELLRLRAEIKTCVHDLRNALAAQTAAVHLLTKSTPDSEHALMLGRALLGECQKLNDVINHLAELAITDARTELHEMQDALTAPAPARASQDASASVAIGQRKRILVVDDNVDAALTLAAVLRLEGYEVITAHDGVEALRTVQSLRPDIVVLDIEMPVMNGYEAAIRIRQECSSFSCKLIAVSGHSNLEDRQRALAAGFDAHLTKPIDPEALVRHF